MTPAGLKATLLTAPGRGAVATLALQGELGLLCPRLRLNNGRPPQEQTVQQICFGHWVCLGHGDSADAEPGAEEVVYCRISEFCAELHCHGGPQATARIAADLRGLGANVIPTAEFLQQTVGSLAAADVLKLSQATTARSAQLLLRQAQLWSRWLRGLEEQDELTRRTQIEQVWKWREFGRHLTEPWRVVLTGAPNVGKSTLLNALVGYSRAIVLDRPGTTRDVLVAQTAVDGWPVCFVDTAGVRETLDPLEAEGIRRAQSAVQEADLTLLVVDTSTSVNDVCLAATEGTGSDARSDGKTLIVRNKADLFTFPPGAGAECDVSALHGTGLTELLNTIAQRLVPELPPPDQPVPCHDDHIKLLEFLGRGGGYPS